MKSNVISINSYKMNYQVCSDESVSDLLNVIETKFKNGEKNLAVSSTHYNSLQQKLILLALYRFNLNYPKLKIGAISFACDSGNFKEFTAHANATVDEGIFNFSGHFDLISWKYLIDNKLEKSITASYDILIWELPELEKLVSMSLELKESLAQMNSLFIISNRLSTDDEADFAHSVCQYFMNHGVDISKILPFNGFKKAS